MVTKSRTAAMKRVYQLHVELDEVEPRVWRRRWVPGTVTMSKLDRIIQTAMGWTNSHLNEFEVDKKRYGIPDDEEVHDTPTLDDRRYKVGAVLGETTSGFSYTYDFGDNWRHTVTIETRILPDESFNTWPVCIAGQNDCPPEDVGGVCGHAEFLEAFADPSHDLRQRIELPWTEEFFTIPAQAPHGQHPKLGSLHASMMRALQAAYQAVREDG